jgi:hypothetical protein
MDGGGHGFATRVGRPGEQREQQQLECVGINEKQSVEKGSAATPKNGCDIPGCRGQQKRPMRCSYAVEHTAGTPLGQSHETRNSLGDSLKSHLRKERKDIYVSK